MSWRRTHRCGSPCFEREHGIAQHARYTIELGIAQRLVDRQLHRAGRFARPRCTRMAIAKERKLCAQVDVQRLEIDSTSEAVIDNDITRRHVNAILVEGVRTVR